MTVIEVLKQRVYLDEDPSSSSPPPELAWDPGELWRETRRIIHSGTKADEGDEQETAKGHYLTGLFALSVLLLNGDRRPPGTEDAEEMYVTLLASTVERLAGIVQAQSKPRAEDSPEVRDVGDGAAASAAAPDDEEYFVKRYRHLIARASSKKERSDLELELARRMAEKQMAAENRDHSTAMPDLLTGDDPFVNRQSAALWAPAMADIRTASPAEIARHDAGPIPVGLKSFFSSTAPVGCGNRSAQALTMADPADLAVYPALRDASHPVLLEIFSTQDYLVRQIRVLGSGGSAVWNAQRCALLSVAVSVIKKTVESCVASLSTAYGLFERGFSEDSLRNFVARIMLQPVAGRLQLLYRDKNKEALYRAAATAFSAFRRPKGDEVRKPKVVKLGVVIDTICSLYASPYDTIKALRDVCQEATSISSPGADGLLDTLVEAISACKSTRVVSELDWIEWFVSIDAGGEDSYVLATFQAALGHILTFQNVGYDDNS